jgi:hypothetical protein
MIRAAFTITPDMREADPLDVIGDWETQERKTRKRRSKAEQKTNPYEFRLQIKWVKDLRLMLAQGYIVQANLQEDSRNNPLCSVLGQEEGWPDLGVYGDGRCWLIENKDAEGKLTRAQKLLHPRIIAAGIPLLPICRSLDAAVAFLRANGARFRGVIQ